MNVHKYERASGVQKRVLDPLKLELEDPPNVGARNGTLALQKNKQLSNLSSASSISLSIFCNFHCGNLSLSCLFAHILFECTNCESTAFLIFSNSVLVYKNSFYLSIL